MWKMRRIQIIVLALYLAALTFSACDPVNNFSAELSILHYFH
jgi:hypothetical protein